TVAGLLAGAAPAAPQLDRPVAAGQVATGALSFDGHASVGDFTGTPSEATGEITSGPDLVDVRGWVAAPVRSLETANKKRDRDLDRSMESDKYPAIRLELSGVTPAGGMADSAAATLGGRMLIHGVAREVSLPAEIRPTGQEIRVRSDFPLDLQDYEIGGLSKLLRMLRMQEEIEVHGEPPGAMAASGRAGRSKVPSSSARPTLPRTPMPVRAG
ncbi:MAG TPA: YceI family protein, partial [Gemmatimonadales bacterium]|nr:YceI family protein [Gemmatimonadales bacterium]